MDKLFFSRDNYNLLNKIIGIKIKELHNTDLDPSYNKLIVESMKSVYSTINPVPPSNLTPKKYLDMINIKCLQVAIPNITNSINSKPVQRPQYEIHQEQQQKLNESFMASQQNNKKDFNDTGDYLLPKNSNDFVDDNIDKKFEEIENNRRTENINREQNISREQNIERQVIRVQKEKPASIDETTSLFNQKMQERGIVPQPSSNSNSNTNNELETFVSGNSSLAPVQFETNLSPDELLYERNNRLQQLKRNEEPLRPQIKEDAYNPNSVSNIISPVMFPEKPRYVKRVRYFTVDSRDRDLEIYPNPSYFQVKFAPATDDIITKSFNVKSDMYDILYTIREDVSGERGASITRDYSNIYYLQCTQALVPLEAIYVCGICPNRYYNNTIDSVCEHNPSINDRIIPIEQHTNKAIWNNKIGIQTTVLDVPYLLLDIEELESYSPYSGTNTANRNAFAKLVYDTNFGVLSPFIKMITSSTDEYYVYAPTALGRLDKMTLQLNNPEGNPFFFGRDKLFVEKFERSPNYLKNCPSGLDQSGNEFGVFATRVYIDTSQSFCSCETRCNCNAPLKSSCLKPGDLIYFYNTRPCKPVYVMFQNKDDHISYNNFRLIVNEETTDTYNISINIIVNGMTQHEEPIDFSKFADVDNYLALLINNKDEFFNILEIDSTNITINKNGNVDLMTDFPISKVGYAKQNNKGFQTNVESDLISVNGVRVCAVGDATLCGENDPACIPGNPTCTMYQPDNPGPTATNFISVGVEDQTNILYFDIDYPFDNLSPNILGESYKDGQIFFIKQKLQISYTFKVVSLEKDYNPIESYLVGP